MAATSAAAEVDAEASSILERAAASSFPPLHVVHHLLSVGPTMSVKEALRILLVPSLEKQMIQETEAIQEFCSLFQLPPEKLSRNVSQSCWIIDDERMGEASVEEIIGENVRAICKGDGYKFHAARREDIDVGMLGSGCPFLVEVLNVRSIPSANEVQQIAAKINDSEKKYARIRNIKLVGSEIWTMMREGEAEKQKQYAALIWTSRPLRDDDLRNISLIKDMYWRDVKRQS
uniref:tRNA pseudouridine(55) synthase n=1 Tax=Leersia perrieri TaxID=77586 RepID=A0A0D9W862_9ORYZ